MDFLSLNVNDIWGRVAVFVDKILEGAKSATAGGIATKCELVTNLKIAKALGITIPQVPTRCADGWIRRSWVG